MGFVFPLLGLLLEFVPVPGTVLLADGVAVDADGVAVLAHGVAVVGIPPGIVPGVVICPAGVRFDVACPGVVCPGIPCRGELSWPL